MAAAVVVTPNYAVPSEGGDTITINYTVAISPGAGAQLIFESCDVTVAPGDTPNSINAKLGVAVRARATAHGVTVPSNGVTAPAYSKA